MTGVFIPLFPGIPGGPELIVILLIAILLFGANKIPELARSSGQAIGEFQKGRQQVEEELEDMKGEGVEEDSEFEAAEQAQTDTVSDGTTESEVESEVEGASDSDTSEETTSE